MSHLLRRIIFYIFLVSFLAITPCILLYAKGYNFNWQKKTLTQTGAFYFKSQPKNATVLINGKQRDKTPCLIKHLTPGKYQVTVQVVGFHPWQKTLEISENLVSEAREILLIPQTPSLELIPLKGPLGEFSLNQGGEKMVYFNQNSQEFFYLNLNNRLQQRLQTTTSTPEIISWSKDNSKVLVHTDNNWQIIDLEDSKIIQLRSKTKPIQKIIWHPLDKNKIFFLQADNLYVQDYKNKESGQMFISGVFDFAIANNLLFFLKKPGYFLYQADLAGNNLRQLSLRPFLKNEVEGIKLIISDNNQIALMLDNDLYLYNDNKRLFENVYENVKSAGFSPDNNKLALATPNEIWVYYLREQRGQLPKQAGQKDLITRLSQEIIEVIWHPYDSSHLIFTTADKIRIAEIDDRDEVNITDFLSVRNPQLQYCPKTNRLYFIDDQKLFSLKLP